MTGQTAEQTVHYVTEVRRRGVARRTIRVLASLASDGECTFELLGHKDEAPEDATVVERGRAIAPGWPRGTVMARDISRETHKRVLAGPIWQSFVGRSLRQGVEYTDQRIEEHGKTMQVTASVAESRPGPARDGVDYPTRPAELAAAVLDIALVQLPAPELQRPSVF